MACNKHQNYATDKLDFSQQLYQKALPDGPEVRQLRPPLGRQVEPTKIMVRYPVQLPDQQALCHPAWVNIFL